MIKNLKIRITTIVCLLVIMASAYNSYFYTSDKLSSSLINCITQDSYGYIWVGTEYGLNKFDGYHFVHYLHDSKDTTSITDNTISSFLVDHQKRLWIGCAKGLMQYDYHHNRFLHYPFPDARHPRIYSLIEDHKGNILIGTAGYGLYSISKGQDHIIRQKEYSKKDTDVFFTHIYEDKRHYLWQSSHLSTFTRFQKIGNRIIMKDFDSPFGAPVAFFPSKENHLLIICMFGIADYNYATQQLNNAGYDMGPYKGNITINCAHIDRFGNLYIGTSESGVLIAHKGSRHFIPLQIENNGKFNLCSSFVNDIIEDKNHNLWIGCYKKGLYQVNNEQQLFDSWSFAAQNYKTGSSISSIAAGENGNVWCTVQNSGIFKLAPNGKIISHPQSPSGTSIIYRDHLGHYWLGTGNALYSYNPATGASINRLQFESAGIYSIADNGDGRLFISVYSKGIFIFNTHTNKVQILNMSKFTHHGQLCNDWVRHLMFDHQGLLWIATSNGVACLNTKNFDFKTFGWNSILNNIQADYLSEDNNGNILIGTDNGLYLFDRNKNKAFPFPGAQQLEDKQICAIVKDHHNNLWISTTMGIWQYHHKTLRFLSYISGNGLAAREYERGSALHLNNDRVLFGYDDGITAFYPSRINHSNKHLGKVFLTNFIIDGKSIDCMQPHFNIPYSQNSFTLEFSLLNYKDVNNIAYLYRINDSPWQSTDEGINSITLTKLQPGDYTIEVRATNNGLTSPDITKINITVCHPWYSSTLAWLFYALVAIGLLYYFFRAYERKRKVDLDEQKMQFLINATHDIRSPLTLILSPLHELKKRLSNSEDQKDLDIIDHNAQRLLLLANQILDERKIDKEQLSLHCQATDLVEFASNILKLYQYHARERNITLRIINENLSGQPIIVWIDRMNFDKVINNLLSNAIKYTFDGGEIDIILSQVKGYAVLKVLDSGIGLKETNTEHLFERFYQGKNSTDFHITGTGIGLNLCQAIVHLHSGSIKAANRTDGQRGASFTVSLPLGNSHLKPEEIMTEDGEKEQHDNRDKTKKQPASKNIHILVVDDDVEIARYISDELGRWYHFNSASNGKEALKQLLANRYDLVISDIMMPEMDGITLLKEIKSNNHLSDIPVVLLTSKGEIQNRLEGFKRGADAFLAKPFNMEELHILIDNLVANIRRLKGKYSGAQDQTDKVEHIEVKGNNDVLMNRIMSCINENIGNPDFNVEELTEIIGISRAQLHRKMKEITGISSGEFIRNIRLEQAAQLIKKGKINITQVAYAVGFNNQTHFSTVFKKHFGMTPTEYAQETNKNQQVI